MNHLRYAGLPHDQQMQAFVTIIQSQGWLMAIAKQLQDLGLPDGWIVSGALYNTVWNVLTDRDPVTGIKDIDIFYCDKTDLSYEAEDQIIRQCLHTFSSSPVRIEIRNQARVHLWFEKRFGFSIPPYTSSTQSIECFSSRPYALGIKLANDGELVVSAPFGFEDLFSFRLSPNLALPNRLTHEAKARRALQHWPELTFIPWP